MQNQYIIAEELQAIMGISRGKAYEIIRSCNQELKAQGFDINAAEVEKTMTENEKTAPISSVGADEGQSIFW